MHDIDAYLEKCRETFVADYPDPIAYFAVGLGGEAGEVLNQIQKVMRGDDILDDDGHCRIEFVRREKLRGELGGVAWFFVMLCDSLGLKPSEVLDENVRKLEQRRADGTIRGDGDDR